MTPFEIAIYDLNNDCAKARRLVRNMDQAARELAVEMVGDEMIFKDLAHAEAWAARVEELGA